MQGTLLDVGIDDAWPAFHESKFDQLLGLDFSNVLGDALCDERGLARRLPRFTPWCSRHRVRPELVQLLRNSARASVPSRVDRGNVIAWSADLLRPAGHRWVRSCDAERTT